MGFNGSLSFEIWVDIQGCGRMGLVVLKVYSEDIEWSGNLKKNLFVWMRHGGFVVGISIVELLFEILQLEENGFGFKGYRCD